MESIEVRLSRFVSFGIAVAMAASTIACGDAGDGAVTGDDAEVVSGRDVSFAGIVFHIPSTWGVIEDGDQAWMGKGGEKATRNLLVRKNFTGTIEELAPAGCTPYQMEAGFKRIGELTAEYRKWSVECDGKKSDKATSRP